MLRLTLVLFSLLLFGPIKLSQGSTSTSRPATTTATPESSTSSSGKPVATTTSDEEPVETSSTQRPIASTTASYPQSVRPQSPPRRQQVADDEYLIGVGLADITGPAADINLMGYAKPSQDSGGIHLRQFSRAILVEDSRGVRVVYVSIDAGMISQLLRLKVLQNLTQKYGHQMFNQNNLMMTASHSHSCPGGFFQYMLYNIPSSGFVSQTLEALVDGIVLSIDRATNNLKRGRIYYNQGELLDASINRSPTSYDNNPAEERARYRHNTDKLMHLLKMVDSSGRPLAMLNWFPVHGTSMNNSNHLISSDNKGFASILFEQDFNPPATLPGQGSFVAIFAQANEGDVSPNTMGARCTDTGLPCDPITSTCGNPPRNEKCVASGPGKDMFESTKIIAYKQYFKARQLFLDESSQQLVRGPIRFIHEHIDITNQVVPLYKSIVDLARTSKQKPVIAINATYRTCPAALGYSFAAGTTDGPGAFDFTQADTASSRYWNMVRDFLRRPSDEQDRCHHPKPIFLSTGEMDFPYMWHPKVVPTQIIMIGQIVVVGLPGEFTTMAGRRVRDAVQSTMYDAITRGSSIFSADSLDSREDAYDGDTFFLTDQEKAQMSRAKPARRATSLKRNKRAYSVAPEIRVILSGLSNIYISYITTVEEYEIQRYEAASTLYGPHTLQAFVNQFRKLASYLVMGQPLPDNFVHPPNLTSSLFSLQTGVLYDGTPHGRSFGEPIKDANTSRIYQCQDVVTVSFVAGNPRNDLRHEGSFLYVDYYLGNGTWTTVATDASWETKFIWTRTNSFFGESRADIIWEIPVNCMPGIYKIRHYGTHKNLLQSSGPYSGESSLLKVNDGSLSSTKLDLLLESALESHLTATGMMVESEQKRVAMDQQSMKESANQPASPTLLYSPIKYLGSLFGWRSKA